MAHLLNTSTDRVLDLGYSMGLPRKRTLTADQLKRIYVTVIRQNWQVLPEDQITELLGWDREKFEFTLKEDDFLGLKLGPKPRCAPVIYAPLSNAEREQTARIRRIVRETLGASMNEPGEPLFHFITELSDIGSTLLRDPSTAIQGKIGEMSRTEIWSPRYLYSYFALYGDPLMQPDIDPFPDGYLEKLAAHGINGVWMQAVLNTLAPSARFREFGAGSEVRLANLRKLIGRAQRFGVKVYLYLNEPRAMPVAFFAGREGIKGRSEQGMNAMCTTAPEVREWMADSLAHILRQVPELGGFFTITMSENLTNCFSHGGDWGLGAPNAGDCPRCSARKSWDVIGELIQNFRNGIRRSSTSAELINWDWGWGDALARNLIPLLPKDTRLLSVSEWEQPFHRGGVDSEVGEYSISVVGPGPRARRNWELARKCGIAPMAKVQFNNTWEISAVPYIPVTHLILRHCEHLARTGIAGLMVSWTCGGYPSPNLEAAKAFYLEPRPTQQQILESVAQRRYGAKAMLDMIEAWRRFSDAFEQFPYAVAIYTIPTQHGPANLLRFHPSGYSASMILFPQDDLKGWCGAYTAQAVLTQFRKMAQGWADGLTAFRAGFVDVPDAKRVFAETDLAIAETCYNHFQSVANQVEFYILREKLTAAVDKEFLLARMRALAEDEIELARNQFRVARHHSVIAYEASNHYYYTPLDLAEKILNCRQLIDQEIPSLG